MFAATIPNRQSVSQSVAPTLLKFKRTLLRVLSEDAKFRQADAQATLPVSPYSAERVIE